MGDEDKQYDATPQKLERGYLVWRVQSARQTPIWRSIFDLLESDVPPGAA